MDKNTGIKRVSGRGFNSSRGGGSSGQQHCDSMNDAAELATIHSVSELDSGCSQSEEQGGTRTGGRSSAGGTESQSAFNLGLYGTNTGSGSNRELYASSFLNCEEHVLYAAIARTMQQAGIFEEKIDNF